MLDHFDRFPSTTALMLASGAFLVSATAQAEPTPTRTKLVSLEVRDQEPGRTTAVERVSVPLSDRGSTKLDSWLRGSRYKLQVVRESESMPDALSLELHREPRGDSPQSAEISASAVVRMKPGQRVVIARIERSNGSRTEVSATIR
jgi:hypothetical protein